MRYKIEKKVKRKNKMPKAKRHAPPKLPREEPKPSTRPKNHTCCICGDVSHYMHKCDWCPNYFCDGTVYNHSDITGYSHFYDLDDHCDFLCDVCFKEDQEIEHRKDQDWNKVAANNVKHEANVLGYNGKPV